MLVLEALADPVRRAVVERLAEGDVGAGELAAAFPISRPAVSRHLRVLREAGLVTCRASGQERIYSLQRGPLRELDAWLERFRPSPRAGPSGQVAGPAARLDALDTEMARGRRRRRRGPDDEGDSRDRSTG